MAIKDRSPPALKKPWQRNYQGLNDLTISYQINLKTNLMNSSHKQGTVALSSVCRPPKIPVQLALSICSSESKAVTFQIPVLETSMEPTLKYGSPISIQWFQDPVSIEPGGIYYIVDASLRGSLRRAQLHSNEDYIRLYCDNPDKSKWPAHLMRVASIHAIFKVANCLVHI